MIRCNAEWMLSVCDNVREEERWKVYLYSMAGSLYEALSDRSDATVL